MSHDRLENGGTRKPIRIAHVVHSLELGGLENGLVNLVNALDADRFQHSIVCLTRAGSFSRRIDREGISIIELGAAGDNFRFPVMALARLFRRLGCDIVHTRGWGAVDAVFAARWAGVPAVIHGEHGREWTDTAGANWKRNQIRRLVGYLVKRYVVVSDFFRPWLIGKCGVSEDKIVYIPNGVDTRRFSPRRNPEPDCENIRAQLGLPTEGILIGSVGRLDPVKDISTLLRSFAAVHREFPETRLGVVGDGPLRQNLEALARALDLQSAVFWLGRRDDVSTLLPCFDVFVQSSLFEGMSNTILEAMASGLPVIASETGGNGELVANHENGLLFPVGDVSALYDCLRQYISDGDLRRGHGLASRRRALEKFGMDRMAARYADLYLRSC